MTFYFVVRFFVFPLRKKDGRTGGISETRERERERERERGAYEGILNSRGCRDWSPFNPTQPSTHIHTRYAQKEEEKEKEKQKIEGVLLFSPRKESLQPRVNIKAMGPQRRERLLLPYLVFFLLHNLSVFLPSSGG